MEVFERSAEYRMGRCSECRQALGANLTPP